MVHKDMCACVRALSAGAGVPIGGADGSVVVPAVAGHVLNVLYVAHSVGCADDAALAVMLAKGK